MTPTLAQAAFGCPKCCKCDQLAMWHYAPASDEEDNERDYCEDHVRRGCSCVRGETDELGRELPCCEYCWLGEFDEAE